MRKLFATTIFASGILLGQSVVAESPQLKNSGTIIYLADNLDEKDMLGWCIDTLGRGQSDAVQAHSCKPDSTDSRNRDVLFTYDADQGRIAHAEYENLCLSVNAEGSETVFGLITCDMDAANQKFTFAPESGAIHPASDISQCIAVGADSRRAGPFMSRSLGLVTCGEADASLRTWVIQE